MTGQSAFNLSRLAEQWQAAAPSPLDAALISRRARGETWIDLITANPHEHGLIFPDDALAEIVEQALPMARVYRPDALGLSEAREAIADYYRSRNTAAEAARIVLTPGTSMAYLYALKLVIDGGGEVLIPSPGYPLFDDLCDVAGAGLRKYHLMNTHGKWMLDVDEIEFQCTAKTRAIIVVSPHNPTGAMPDAKQWSELGALCRRRGLAMILDEVFCEHIHIESGPYVRPNPDEFPLLLTLNGFSKMFSLPGWKIGWMKIDGEMKAVGDFMRAIEHMSDTFLPVPELQQAMIAPLMRAADRGVITRLNEDIQNRKRCALGSLREYGWRVDESPAGVYLCVRLPPGERDEPFALRMLNECGVLVHPGYFYDLPNHWVMTCIAETKALEEGIRRIGLAGE